MSLRTLARVWLAACAACVMATGRLALHDDLPPWLAGAAMLAAIALVPAVAVLALRWVNPPTTAMMAWTKRRRARRGQPPALSFEWTPIERVSRDMWLAAIVAEDATFRVHSGFDWKSLRDARAYNRRHARKRGGSTITQQMAKNLFLWPARSYVRKAIEAYLTAIIEALWTKRRILEVYLNIAQFGADVFGVGAAARRYFGKPAAELTPQEAARLAAALPDPVRHDVVPVQHRLRFRQFYVLATMRLTGDRPLEQL